MARDRHLRAHQRFERGGEVARRNETTSAPEKAIHEVQHLCQLAQLSAGRRSSSVIFACRANPRRDDADIRDAIHRIALSDRFYGYRRIAEQLKREGLCSVNSKRVRRLMRPIYLEACA